MVDGCWDVLGRDWIGLGTCWGESVRCPIDEGTKKGKRAKKRDEGRERRVESGSYVPRQHLMVILTLFDYFNNLNNVKPNLDYGSKL